MSTASNMIFNSSKNPDNSMLDISDHSGSPSASFALINRIRALESQKKRLFANSSNSNAQATNYRSGPNQQSIADFCDASTPITSSFTNSNGFGIPTNQPVPSSTAANKANGNVGNILNITNLTLATLPNKFRDKNLSNAAAATSTTAIPVLQASLSTSNANNTNTNNNSSGHSFISYKNSNNAINSNTKYFSHYNNNHNASVDAIESCQGASASAGLAMHTSLTTPTTPILERRASRLGNNAASSNLNNFSKSQEDFLKLKLIKTSNPNAFKDKITDQKFFDRNYKITPKSLTTTSSTPMSNHDTSQINDAYAGNLISSSVFSNQHFPNDSPTHEQTNQGHPSRIGSFHPMPNTTAASNVTGDLSKTSFYSNASPLNQMTNMNAIITNNGFNNNNINSMNNTNSNNFTNQFNKLKLLKKRNALRKTLSNAAVIQTSTSQISISSPSPMNKSQNFELSSREDLNGHPSQSNVLVNRSLSKHLSRQSLNNPESFNTTTNFNALSSKLGKSSETIGEFMYDAAANATPQTRRRAIPFSNNASSNNIGGNSHINMYAKSRSVTRSNMAPSFQQLSHAQKTKSESELVDANSKLLRNSSENIYYSNNMNHAHVAVKGGTAPTADAQQGETSQTDNDNEGDYECLDVNNNVSHKDNLNSSSTTQVADAGQQITRIARPVNHNAPVSRNQANQATDSRLSAHKNAATSSYVNRVKTPTARSSFHQHQNGGGATTTSNVKTSPVNTKVKSDSNIGKQMQQSVSPTQQNRSRVFQQKLLTANNLTKSATNARNSSQTNHSPDAGGLNRSRTNLNMYPSPEGQRQVDTSMEPRATREHSNQRDPKNDFSIIYPGFRNEALNPAAGHYQAYTHFDFSSPEFIHPNNIMSDPVIRAQFQKLYEEDEYFQQVHRKCVEWLNKYVYPEMELASAGSASTAVSKSKDLK